MQFRDRRLLVSVLLAFPASGVLAAEIITTPEVSVTSQRLQPLPTNTASLLDDQPGISLYRAGALYAGCR